MQALSAQGAAAEAPPEAAIIGYGDIRLALAAGWRDFLRAPVFGLFFSAVYVLAGLALIRIGAGTLAWTLTISLGFPLVAPFAAVGLYEVSRRIEKGEPLSWPAVLGVVAAERGRQTVWLGAIMVIAFLFWSFFAHMLFALVMGITALRTGQVDVAALLTPAGLVLVTAELAVGGLFALLLYGVMVIALPLCLDREVDFVTAMLLSLRVVRASPGPMLLWAALIAGLTLLGMAPALLGLTVVLPVLGHASWHLYRRAVLPGPAGGAA